MRGLRQPEYPPAWAVVPGFLPLPPGEIVVLDPDRLKLAENPEH